MSLNPTPLRISTMTVTGHLGATPDLAALFRFCTFIPYWWIGEGIIKIEYTDDKKIRHTKGVSSDDILHQTTKSQRQFCNQSSLVIRYRLSDGSWKETNIKLFKNGGFQMTGVCSEAMARLALERLIALHPVAPDSNNGSSGSHKDRIWTTPPTIARFEVRMMNSDYNVGAPIRRDRLYKILVEEYGLWCNYEPTIYQGVNTKFFWNAGRPAAAPPGICTCLTQCKGDAPGDGPGRCKKITISPFRTGSVIITGAQTVRQLDDAYVFMNDLLRKHPEILRLEDDSAAAETPKTLSKRKTVVPTTTLETLQQKIRTSPRGLIKVCG